MKQTTLITTFLFVTLLCFGQKEHLEPAKDFSNHDLKEYYESLFSKLHAGFTEKPYACYTSLPSFSENYAFSIETIEGKNYIITNGFSENYWYAKNREEVKLITNKAEIEGNLCFKIGELFQLLAEQTKEIKKEVVIDSKGFTHHTAKVDGTTYYFSTVDKNGEAKTGETWSPPKNSLFRRLITICDNLHSMGKGEKEISQTDISKEIDKLITDLK